MPSAEGAISAPPAIERFVKQLVVAWKAVLLYPPASAIPRRNAEIAAVTLRESLRTTAEVILTVSKNGIGFGGHLLFQGQPGYENFALELYQRNLADIRFHAGADGTALLSFLTTLKADPAELEAGGGVEARLWQHGVDTVTVTEAHVAVVDGQSVTAMPVEQGPAPEIDALVAGTLAGNASDTRVLMRVVADTEVLRSWIHGQGAGFDSRAAYDRIADLAHAASMQPAEDRHAAYAGIAAGILALPADERRDVLLDRVLPAARQDNPLGGVIRSADVIGLCVALVRDEPETAEDREKLARGIRGVSAVSAAPREEVLAESCSAMLHGGFKAETADAVLQMAAPSHILVGGADESIEEASVCDTTAGPILEVLGLPPTGPLPPLEDDPAFESLVAEAYAGVTDGDVVSALVSLVTIDPGSEHAAESMTAIEADILLLIERGEVDLAAEAVEELQVAADRPDTPEKARVRIQQAMERLARPEDLRMLLKTVRTFPHESVEHRGAARLLGVIGGRAIEPMLEVLAEEPDMAARKAIVDLLSGMAADHVPELAVHLTDPRWYFVRNVVAVMGAAKRSTTLTYLQRTVRHGDARVRRETIRAVSALPDGLATQMLEVALEDEDAQNVQLAARYLASRNSEEAVAPLEAVARGEGRGNRDVGPRIEAIEALGTIGTSQALATLDEIAGKRSLLSRGRNREIRAAASAAANRIRQGGRS